MVSEKVIIILIVVAILLSVVSIAVTISSVNTIMLPEQGQRYNINYEPGMPDTEKAQISLSIAEVAK